MKKSKKEIIDEMFIIKEKNNNLEDKLICINNYISTILLNYEEGKKVHEDVVTICQTIKNYLKEGE